MFRLLLIFVICVCSCESQSSCSDIFQYVNEGREKQGLITFDNPEPIAEIHLKIQLSVSAALTSKYVGALSLVKNREDARNDIMNNRPLLYRVQFPVQNPLPKVTSILYNNRLICSGPPDRGSYVTTISLEHTFFTGLQNQPNSFNNQPTSFNNQPSSFNNQQPAFNNQQPARQPEYNYDQQPLPTEAPSNNIGCGLSAFDTFTSLVIGGQAAQRGKWPWIVAFYKNINNRLSFICGGSLISKSHVVTAAHCIQDKRTTERQLPERSLFFFGKHNLNDNNEVGYQQASARRFIIHEDWNIYDLAYDADIAIAVLDTQIQFTDYVRPICLWTQSDDLNLVVGKVGVVVGWGKNEYNNLNTEYPKMVDTPIVSDSFCLRSNPVFQQITSLRTFCAGGRRGEGPCKGDSGSGLVLFTNNKWYLRGVVSASLSKTTGCDVDNFAVFTDVAKYGSWINNNMI
ncbi:unnamed protein product [Diamesa tonsa]